MRLLADNSGRITDRYTYDAFGNLISSYGNTKNDFLFAGEQFDPVTGLYYLRARYMDTNSGRFISMDTYEGSIDDPVSLHKYLYANSDPVNNVDPSGYHTLAETETATGIQGILNNTLVTNIKAIWDGIGGIIGVAQDVISTYKEGKELGLDKEEIAANIAAGLLTSIVTNFSCMLTSLGPVGYVLMGIAALVVGIIAAVNFAEGNTSMGIAQVLNLVSIVFSMFNPTCFTADTPVYTDIGMVCIEDVAVGDMVWSRNYDTGEVELKEVLIVWVKQTDELVHVTTEDGEIIDTTSNHPFYVDGKGWVAAGDLEVGDELLAADGEHSEVTDVEFEKLDEPVTVYNLVVDDDHTYYVGKSGVLVHNTYKTEWGPEHKIPNEKHNNAIEDTLTAMESYGATDLMKNKGQVNSLLEKVSNRRPDASFTFNDIRYNFNFVSNPSNPKEVSREISAYLDILLSDPEAVTWLFFDY